MLKVITIVGTRPEIIKLSRVISELDKHTNHILVHTGQNYDYELNEIFFKDMGIRRPDHFLEAAGSSSAETIGNIIAKSDQIFEKEKPDALLIYGDTNSCLSVIPAKRRQIPIFHMEAGNRSFDQRVPEEINRKIVDHLSDINMPITEHARRYLLAEGIKPETIIKTGSCMKEVLMFHKREIENCDILKRLELTENHYFVVSAHREENVSNQKNLLKILEALDLIVKKYDKPVIFSVHPRTKKEIDKLKNPILSSEIRFLKPLGFFEYIALQKDAFCVISDSGTITEESSLLGFPAITIRQSHERPEGMDVGTLIMSGLDSEDILNSIDIVTSQKDNESKNFGLVQDYDTELVSRKVVRIIVSYIHYINRTVWFKNLN